jgi:hypothetical protein
MFLVNCDFIAFVMFRDTASWEEDVSSAAEDLVEESCRFVNQDFAVGVAAVMFNSAQRSL